MKFPLFTLLLATCALSAGAQTLPAENPFSKPSTLPYQLPPFDKIKVADYTPAFEAGMAEQRREVDAIVKNAEAPTFENTIVAMERTGSLLTRVSRVFFNLNSSDTNDEMQKIDMAMAPRLTAHQDEISLDPALFARIKTIYDQREKLGLDPESAQLLKRYYMQFVRSGALLPETEKTKLKEINKTLSTITTQFSQNLLKEVKKNVIVVDKVEDLDGLSPERIAAAAEAAKERKLEGKWALTLQNTTIQSVLDSMKNRALRERIYRASIARNNGGEFDNTALVSKIAELRAKQANLLGYPTYAAYSLEDEGAANPEAVNKMLGQLGPMALLKAKDEAAGIQELINAEAKANKTEPFTLQPWDWSYYAQQVRNAKYSFDEAQVKPYFELNRVLNDGVFYAAKKLYGITFKERKDLPVYNPDVRVYEAFNEDGSALALFLLDPYKRDSKQGGAWMEFYVDQSGLFAQKPVIVNNLNVVKPAAGQVALLTFDEVETMFHEFGHALHGMFSAVKYPTLAGTNVPADFVEFPSQMNEMFLREPEVLANFARHYQTGEAMPKELQDKVIASMKYGQGYATTEYVAAAMIDQSWHQLAAAAVPQAAGVPAFEEASLKSNGMDYAPVPPRYHTPYFAHSFGGYAASYYAYIWSEVLARDISDYFHKHGGITRANGDRLRGMVLSRGRTVEPGVLFEAFYGGKPEIGPLLDWRGLTVTK